MNTLNLESFAHTAGESKFFKKLVELITKERAVGNVSSSQLTTSGIMQLIKEETGINISKIDTSLGKGGFAIQTPFISGKDINITRFYLDEIKDQEIDNKEIFSIDNAAAKNEWYGYIDLKNHKVSGIFAKLPSILYLSQEDFYGTRFSPEQVAAVIFHEIGHAMYGFMNLAHVVTFNVIFQSINEQLQNAGEDKYKYTLFDMATRLRLGKEDIATIERSKTNQEGYNVLLTSAAEKIKSTTNNLSIDRTFNESYADIFVVRNGAGKHLFDALNILFQDGFFKSGYGSKTASNFIAVGADLLISLLGAVYFSLGIVTLIPYVAAATFVLWNITKVVVGEQGGDVYEDPKERLTRIKMDTLGELRQKVSKERRTQLNEQLLAMNKVLKVIHDDRVPYNEYLKSINPAFRRYRNEQAHQRVLQEIGRHDLILASSTLKEMA